MIRINIDTASTKDVRSVLRRLRRLVEQNKIVIDCGLWNGPGPCWSCSIGKCGSDPAAIIAADNALAAVIGDEDPHEYEYWPGEHRRPDVLAAIDAALVLCGGA